MSGVRNWPASPRIPACASTFLSILRTMPRALRAMASLLVPGGVIVLLVPAFPALYGPIDRNLGHYRRYTLDSLTRLAAADGIARPQSALRELRRLFRLVAELPHPETRSPVRKTDRGIRKARAGALLAGRNRASAVRAIAVRRARNAMLISIIIPVYNEFRTFNKVLERVRRAPLPEGCSKEIVVVDDGSTDGTTQMFGEHVRAGVVVGHHSARNAARDARLRTGIALARATSHHSGWRLRIRPVRLPSHSGADREGRCRYSLRLAFPGAAHRHGAEDTASPTGF